MRIRRLTNADWTEWLRMGEALFLDESREEIERSMRDFFARNEGAVFIAERDDGTACGFVEVGLRSYAEGCESSPVAYVEAWYVDEDVRQTGYGRALLRAAEEWAVAAGFREIGSDALLDNVVSHRSHRACGYEEVERIVVFRKSLDRPGRSSA
jgi:aminoglycoside 6'-N-acetyltransferase I